MIYAKYALCAFLLLCMLVLPPLIVTGCSADAPRDDPLTEELTALNVRYSAIWESMREDARDADHLRQLRKEWRAAYDADVVACYARYNKKPPTPEKE